MTEVYYDFTVGDPRYPGVALNSVMYGVEAIPYLYARLPMRLASDSASYGNQVVLTGGNSGFTQPLHIMFADPDTGAPILVRDLSLSVGYVDSTGNEILYAYQGLAGGGPDDTVWTIRSDPPTVYPVGWQTITLPYRRIGALYLNSGMDSAGLGIKWMRFTLDVGAKVPPRRIHPREDGLAGSSAPRHAPGAQSEQGSNRVVGGYL